jgi:hypothetical protein
MDLSIHLIILKQSRDVAALAGHTTAWWVEMVAERLKIPVFAAEVDLVGSGSSSMKAAM